MHLIINPSNYHITSLLHVAAILNTILNAILFYLNFHSGLFVDLLLLKIELSFLDIS